MADDAQRPSTKSGGASPSGHRDDAVPARGTGQALASDDLPVIARLAIEIRSDGTRTVARGAMHDLESGQQVAIEVGSGSVLELGTQLAAAVGKSLLSLPRMLLGRRRSPRG